MKRNKLFWGLLIFCAINFAAHLCFYGSLPDVVPTHWGADGQANGWGPKSTVLIMAALPALMLILMAALPRIDPKHQNYEKFKGVWNASLTALTIFMAAMSWFSELSVFGLIPEGSSLVGILVCGGCGVLFIFLGNYMPRIKQNYMFGCKTPWALNNEHNWNRTQPHGRHCVCCYGCCFDCNFTAGHHFGRCRHHDPAAGRCLWRLRLDLPLLLPRLHRQNEVSKRPHPERTLYPASCLISKKGAQRPPPFFFIIYSLFITKRSPLHAVLLCTGRGAFYFYSWVFFPARSVFMRMRSRWDFSSFL